MISIELEVREKDFRINPGITYFPVFVAEILKIDIGEMVTKDFEKRSRRSSQST